MAEIIRLTPEAELRAIMLETIINNTTKVSKISDNSVLSGIASGNAKVAKKALKDIALVASHLFPDTASGDALDRVASNQGIAARFGASQSSTYIRVVGDPGTLYEAGVNTFTGAGGIVFDVLGDLTIGSKGYGYVKVRSQESGLNTNVDPYTLNSVNPQPTGHIGCINEYAATGGRDIEDDGTFRQRIKTGPDLLTRTTLDFITTICQKFNNDVLRVIYEGLTTEGKLSLGILTQNGIDLTSNELSTLRSEIAPYLPLNEHSPVGMNSTGIELKNVTYYPIDIEFNVKLIDSASVNNTAIDIQTKLSKIVDYRNWNSGIDKIEWEDLLLQAKNSPQVSTLPDQTFSPRVDQIPPAGQFPRFRGFIMRNLDGDILLNQTGTIDPIFYPTEIDDALTETVL